MPQIGDQMWIDGQTYGASANWDENNTTPPTIWQLGDGYTVIRYQDQRSTDYGRTSLNVSFVQANGTFASSTDINTMFDDAINLAVKNGASDYSASLAQKKTTYQNIVSTYSANRNTVSVTASAEGSGDILNQTGAS